MSELRGIGPFAIAGAFPSATLPRELLVTLLAETQGDVVFALTPARRDGRAVERPQFEEWAVELVAELA